MRRSPLVWKALLVIILALSWPPLSWGEKAYKIYTLHSYENEDILCDSYTVQKDDHIWQILRQKGSIAETDFPKFVKILKSLNPHLKDVNRIYPGQVLLIPLKQMETPESPLADGQRYVTIPMIPDVLYRTHKVRSGDSISGLVMSHLGLGWHQIPKDYFDIFRRLNPGIKDMALIYPGQTINIPDLPASQPLPTAFLPVAPMGERVPEPPRPSSKAETPPPEEEIALLREILSQAVNHLGGKLLASGECYFPVKGKEDLRLDLEAFPVIEWRDGRHAVLEMWQSLPQDMEEAVRAFWKGVTVIPADPRATKEVVVDRVFRAALGKKAQTAMPLPAPDDGIQVTVRGDWIFPTDAGKEDTSRLKCVTLIEDSQELTSPSIVAYLAEKDIEVIDILPAREEASEALIPQDMSSRECPTVAINGAGQEAFVRGFAQALGCSYEPNVPISFDYAGFKVKTTANLIYGGKGLDLVVDLGTFYGETKSAVEAMGVQVLSIGPDEDVISIARQILTMTAIAYTENPVFLAANRQVSKATSLTIAGILVSQVDEVALLTRAPVPPAICRFLEENKTRLLKIEPAG